MSCNLWQTFKIVIWVAVFKNDRYHKNIRIALLDQATGPSSSSSCIWQWSARDHTKQQVPFMELTSAAWGEPHHCVMQNLFKPECAENGGPPSRNVTALLLDLIADRMYQANIGALEKIREEWQNEHVKACEVSTIIQLPFCWGWNVGAAGWAKKEWVRVVLP